MMMAIPISLRHRPGTEHALPLRVQPDIETAAQARKPAQESTACGCSLALHSAGCINLANS